MIRARAQNGGADGGCGTRRATESETGARTSTEARKIVRRYTMKEAFGREYRSLLANAWRDRHSPACADLTRDVEQALPDADPAIKAEEIIAVMAEKRIVSPVTVRAIAQIRRFQRSLGFRLSFPYDEAMAMIAGLGRRSQIPESLDARE